MGIVLDWDATQGLWRFTVEPTFTLDEVADLTLKTDWQGARRYLWDLRDLRKGPDSPADLRRAAELVRRSRELWEGSRAAILVNRELDYGVARMFQVFAEGVGVIYEVFRDEPAALAWLAAPDS